ncbi:hypothetical protein [Burkholderia pyrrocinia]|uniref:hypothetical protein n=1 Tax=Burkholderia pyrrocinia TaxID=60550 RepID=UPI0015890BB9|nr:hypothetical protein [Burkholderia pyrrocinia]
MIWESYTLEAMFPLVSFNAPQVNIRDGSIAGSEAFLTLSMWVTANDMPLRIDRTRFELDLSNRDAQSPGYSDCRERRAE